MFRSLIRPLVPALLALVALPSIALAHFNLIEPKPDRTDDTGGKGAKCGATGTSTTDVTNYTPGQTISITVKETVDHDGFYRVALAKDVASLPDAPDGACGTLTPQAPTATILAGNMFLGLQGGPASAPKTESITLPNTNCQNCILQVIEVMTESAGSCYYFHCAKVNVGAALPPGPGPGPGPTPDAGPDDPAATGGGSSGGCSTTSGQSGWLLLALAAIAPLARRRRP
jgi:uncharacterized protein (TIGR03382 family)